MNEQKRNRPMGLAITLVILVASLMLTIVFASKNIAYKQENQLRIGSQMVAQLQQISSQSDYITLNILNKRDSFSSSSEDIQLTLNNLLIADLMSLESALQALFLNAASINPDVMTLSATEGQTTSLSELILQLETGNFITDGQLNEDVSLLMQQLSSGANLFNFKLEGVKSAMIRMSNGFEWVDAVQALDESVN